MSVELLQNGLHGIENCPAFNGIPENIQELIIRREIALLGVTIEEHEISEGLSRLRTTETLIPLRDAMDAEMTNSSVATQSKDSKHKHLLDKVSEGFYEKPEAIVPASTYLAVHIPAQPERTSAPTQELSKISSHLQRSRLLLEELQPLTSTPATVQEISRASQLQETLETDFIDIASRYIGLELDQNMAVRTDETTTPTPETMKINVITPINSEIRSVIEVEPDISGISDFTFDQIQNPSPTLASSVYDVIQKHELKDQKEMDTEVEQFSEAMDMQIDVPNLPVESGYIDRLAFPDDAEQLLDIPEVAFEIYESFQALNAPQTYEELFDPQEDVSREQFDTQEISTGLSEYREPPTEHIDTIREIIHSALQQDESKALQIMESILVLAGNTDKTTIVHDQHEAVAFVALSLQLLSLSPDVNPKDFLLEVSESMDIREFITYIVAFCHDHKKQIDNQLFLLTSLQRRLDDSAQPTINYARIAAFLLRPALAA